MKNVQRHLVGIAAVMMSAQSLLSCGENLNSELDAMGNGDPIVRNLNKHAPKPISKGEASQGGGNSPRRRLCWLHEVSARPDIKVSGWVARWTINKLDKYPTMRASLEGKSKSEQKDILSAYNSTEVLKFVDKDGAEVPESSPEVATFKGGVVQLMEKGFAVFNICKHQNVYDFKAFVKTQRAIGKLLTTVDGCLKAVNDNQALTNDNCPTTPVKENETPKLIILKSPN